ncbi:MAG: TIGR00341 family protein [Legionellales bacterium RIFCSPHIGHO2_12_FULL_37_14]|nr:MAG: TIGR00341 family protein [Legionellales bacterium RIFCSPHIGHO2_12_FULL_37_14]
MALRLIEMVIKAKDLEKAQTLLAGFELIEYKILSLNNNELLVRIISDSDQNEAVLDALETHFVKREGARALILPITSTLPHVAVSEAAHSPTRKRMSREELYEEIKNQSLCSWVYIAMVVLSTVVASFGLRENGIVMIIGAMVIAPMLGPSIGLAFSCTLGDLNLMRNALFSLAVSITITILLSTGLGILVHVDPYTHEIALRTKLTWAEFAVALSSGFAGALAFTTGTSAILIGVMVAVSLLPPLVTCGLLLGSGDSIRALDALSLYWMNLICISIASVLVFLFQGIHPRRWRERKFATKTTYLAIIIWGVMLIASAILIFYLGHEGIQTIKKNLVH